MVVVLRFGLIGAVLGGLLVGVHVAGHRDTVLEGTPFVSTFSPPDGALEVVLVLADGQAFAQLAMDPTLAHPEAFADGRAEQVYRAQRPVYVYATWLLAVGNPAWVPEAMVVITTLSAGLLTGALALLLQRRRIPAVLALPVLFLPGVWAAFPFLMPGALAAGLVLAGLASWEMGTAMTAPADDGQRRRMVGIAGALFALAVLTQETMIFIPAGLALDQFIRTRRLPSLWLALGPTLYAAWWLIVRAITGAALFTESQTRTDTPGVGLLEAISHWSLLGRDSLFAVVTVVLVVAALAKCPRDPLVLAAVIGLAAAALMNVGVWGSWVNWTRAILPVHLALVLALLGSSAGDRYRQPEPSRG